MSSLINMAIIVLLNNSMPYFHDHYPGNLATGFHLSAEGEAISLQETNLNIGEYPTIGIIQDPLGGIS